MITLTGSTSRTEANITGLDAPRSPRSAAGHGALRVWGFLRRLSTAAGARSGALGLTLLLVALQPRGEPWWYTADSDGAHIGNALNLLMGNKTKLLDHPALPMQALLTLGIGADYLVHGWWAGVGVGQYVDECFADPDRVTWIVACLGMIFLLGAVVVAYEVGRRMFGHWHWGVASAGLYLAMPGHLTFATMVRPENILSGSCLLAGYLMWRALEMRSPSRCLLAAFLIGHAVSEKVHAIGMLLPLGVTVVGLLRTDWVAQPVHSSRRCWDRYRGALLPGAALWLGCLVVLNIGREPGVLDWKLFALPGLAVGYLGVSVWLGRRCAGSRLVRTAFNPAYMLTAVALGLGLMVPSMLLLDEIRPLIWQLATLLSGGGVDTGMGVEGLLRGFGVLGERLLDSYMIPLLILAGVGALRVAADRRWCDWLWPVAALGMLVPALCRSSVAPGSHYLAPSLVLLIPLIIRALRPLRVTAAIAEARRTTWLVLALIVAGPYALSVKQTWANVARAEKIAAVSNGVIARLEPAEAVLMNYGAMNLEANTYRQLVDYCIYAPVPELCCFPDVPNGIEECLRQGKRPAYYIMAPGSGRPRIETTNDGRSIASNAWGERFEVEPVASHGGDPIPLEVYRIRRHLPR